MKNAFVIALGIAALVLSGCPTAKNNKVMVDAGPGPATAPAAPMGMSNVPDLPPPPPPSPTPAYVPAPQPMQPAVAPVPAVAAAGQGRMHVVKSGESLWKISAIYYGKASQAGVNRILRANPGVADPSKIKAGQKLVIPD
jgi:nucleoid-associated protein YgaU